MSDRLSELLRQRALVQEHLAWLDRQIADASMAVLPPLSGGGAAPLSPISREKPLVPPAAQPAAVALLSATLNRISPPTGGGVPAATPPPAAEAILQEYRVPPQSLQKEVRTGCFLYFAAAFVILALGVMLLYFAISSR